MSSKMRIKNQLGMTLIEVMVSIGIMGIIGIFAATLNTNLQSQLQRARQSVEKQLSKSTGEAYLLKQWGLASASYNNLTLNFAKSVDNKNFFELEDARRYSATNTSREISLTEVANDAAYLLIDDERVGVPVYVDPVRFYEIGMTVDDATAPLLYVGPQNGSYFSKLAPEMMKEGTSICFYASIEYRAPGSPIDANSLPYTFFVTVRSGNFVTENFNGAVKPVHPITGNPIESLDQFFRQIPPAAGGIPIVMARPVRFLKYMLKKGVSTLGKSDLEYSYWIDGKFDQPQIVLSGIEQISFIRPSLSSTLVKVRVL